VNPQAGFEHDSWSTGACAQHLQMVPSDVHELTCLGPCDGGSDR